MIAAVIGGMFWYANRKPTTPKNDAALACVHFRNVASDLSKGILTSSQIHDKAQEIYDNSAIAPADVQAQAQRLLAATVADDAPMFLSAMSGMAKACLAHGQ